MVNAVWIWGAIGLTLLAIEIATGTFYIFWFGVAALATAVAVWVLPNLSHAFQFIIFAALAVSSLAIWRLNYKKIDPNPRVGQAQGEEIGRTGIVIEDCGPHQTGKIRFTQGLMGAKEWAAISNQNISTGTEAKVVAVEGNSLRVESV